MLFRSEAIITPAVFLKDTFSPQELGEIVKGVFQRMYDHYSNQSDMAFMVNNVTTPNELVEGHYFSIVYQVSVNQLLLQTEQEGEVRLHLGVDREVSLRPRKMRRCSSSGNGFTEALADMFQNASSVKGFQFMGLVPYST